MLTWMAWTWPTAPVFVGVFSAMAVLIVVEIRHPGGDGRKGVLGLGAQVTEDWPRFKQF